MKVQASGILQLIPYLEWSEQLVPHCKLLCMESVVSCSIIAKVRYDNGTVPSWFHQIRFARSKCNFDQIGEKQQRQISPDHALSSEHRLGNTKHCFDFQVFDSIQQNLSRRIHNCYPTKQNRLGIHGCCTTHLNVGGISRPLRIFSDL